MKSKIIFIFLLLSIVFIYLNQLKFILKETYTSPNSEYILELYEETEYKPFFSLSGERAFTEAYVVLKDNQGVVLLAPHWYVSCEFRIGDLQLEWQEEKVYFTKFNFIDLKSYTFNCY